MSLNPGTKLGPYQILAPLGAGGMDSPRFVKRCAFFGGRRKRWGVNGMAKMRGIIAPMDSPRSGGQERWVG